MLDLKNLHPVNMDNIKEITDYLKKNLYKFHQFYNLEIESDEYNFIQYMLNYKDSEKPKVLNKTYYDIETFVNEEGDFTDPEKADRPVNSIAIYNNVNNIAYVIAFVTECNITDPVEIEAGIRELFDKKVQENETYDIPDLTLEIMIVDNEKELLKTFWRVVKEQNTLALIGFNSSIFDDPYMFNRTAELFGKEARDRIVSEFGIVDQYNQSFEIPDYLLVDLLKLYKPVGSGGGGLGKSLPDFKLNTVATKELGITKLDLPGGFRWNYLNDIVGYLTYNIFDTLLTFKLDEKLMFMELMFDLSKYNNASMGATINGRSILYLYRNDLMYCSQNKLIRSKKFSREVLFEPTIKA
jgi:DNA polymerase elongation subunit (family B)